MFMMHVFFYLVSIIQQRFNLKNLSKLSKIFLQYNFEGIFYYEEEKKLLKTILS